MDELEEGQPLEEQGEVPAEEVEEPAGEQSEPEAESVSKQTDWEKKVKSQDRAISKLSSELEQAKGQKEAIDSVRLQQEELSAMMHDVYGLIKGEEVVPTQPISTHYDALQQKRQAEAATLARTPAQAPQQAYPAERARCEAMLELRGWTPDSPGVADAYNKSTPQETIDALREMGRKEDENRITLALQKQLKAHGLTSGGIDSPSNEGLSGNDFLTKFGKGDLPYTQENMNKANKLMGV